MLLLIALPTSLHNTISALPCFFTFFQWKIVSGSACPNVCVSIGSNWRKDTLAAIERHEAGVALQSELMITATAKLNDLQSQQSRKQDELDSLRVITLSLSAIILQLSSTI
jgi:hypothetical protein